MASIKLLVRRSRQAMISLAALASICIGVLLGFLNHSYSSAILLSAGSSMVAAVIVWLFTPANEEMYEKVLSLGITDVYPSRDDVDKHQWVKWLRSAGRSCVLLGTSHSKWCSDDEFRGALEERLRNNVDVRIFFLDPTIPAARLRATEEDFGRDTLGVIRSSIRVLWKIRTALPEDLQSRLKLYVYRATPSMGVTWIDERLMVVSHILAGSMNVTSPCLILEPGRYDAERQGLYETYARNVKSIEDKFSIPIGEDNADTYAGPERPA